MSSFAITYYDFGGRAEPIRMAAYLGGVAFEDHIITMDEQKAQKAEGKRRWSGPPELTIFGADGKELQTIAQSNACLRYAGSITGIYPENPVLRALVDEVLDSGEDTMSLIVRKVLGAKDDDEKKQNIADLFDEKQFMMYMLGKVESRLEENEKRGNKSGFLVGDGLTIADLKFYSILSFVLGNLPPAKAAFAKFVRINKMLDNINNMDKVKAYKAQFDKNAAEFKDKKTRVFKFEGKFVPGSFK